MVKVHILVAYELRLVTNVFHISERTAN